MKKMRFGLIGCGRIGMMHANNIVNYIPGAELVAVADKNMNEALRQRLQDLGVRHLFSDADEVISHLDVDALLIATPTFTHVKLIETIIATNNKPIFCEKPLSLNWSDLVELEKKIKTHNTFLQLGYNRRFDTGFTNVQRAVATGKIGKQYLIAITSFDPKPPVAKYVKEAGMLWTDMNIHDFDMIRNVSQAEITSVFVFGANLVAKELEGIDVDVSVINLTLSNGALAVIKTTRKSPYGYDQRIEVLGEKGRAKIENERPSTFRIDTAAGRTMPNPYSSFAERYVNAFIKEIEAFIEHLRTGQPPEVTIHDDLIALKVARACEVSYKENRIVHLSEVK